VNFEGAEKIAAAILYEGYILYPYRPTAIKNRQRWNFGTLYPRVYAEAQRPPEAFRLVAECLVMTDGEASLDVRVSFLQLMQQQPISSASLTDPSLAWDEAVERSSEHGGLLLKDMLAAPIELGVQWETAGPSTALRSGRDDNSFEGPSGGDSTIDLSSQPERSAVEGPAARQPLQIKVTIGAQVLQDKTYKLRLEVGNTTHLPRGAEAKREEALPLSLVSAHLLLGITGGEFVSLLDPGPAYREAAAACCNHGVFPVLVGEEPEKSMMLCSPIILYDYPKIAPESAGDFFDGTEMDEMLTLRVLTLTDAEKQEMRNGDPRARKILERTEALTSDAMLKAHGVIRGLREIRGDAS
jgi:hypothetical protein